MLSESTSTLTIENIGTWAMRGQRNLRSARRLINRTWLDVASYRDEARSLGYDGQTLDRLVARWRALLESAKRGT